MSEPGTDVAAPGRPTAGQTLAQTLAEAAERRSKSRNVGALRRLAPFAKAHWGDASLAGFFLILSSSATLGITGAVRLLVDNLTRPGAVDGAAAGIDRWFLLMAGVALALALATALRFFFVSKFG
jgi:ATP-binding cassette, subfamily B, bacterial